MHYLVIASNFGLTVMHAEVKSKSMCSVFSGGLTDPALTVSRCIQRLCTSNTKEITAINMIAVSLTVFLTLGAAVLRPAQGLQLVKTEFSGARDISQQTRRAIIDAQFVDFTMNKCFVHDLDITSPFLTGRGAFTRVEQSEFVSITGSSVLETTCQQWTDETDHVVDAGVSTTSYWVQGGTLTCEGVTFQDVVSNCRGESASTCGGAIWAHQNIKKVTLVRCNFIRCSTGEGQSKEMGGAVLCAAPEFQFEDCSVQECSNEKTIIFFRNTGNDLEFEKVVISGCNFTTTSIGPTTDNDFTAGGSGLIIRNTKSLTLVNCRFENNVKTITTNAGDTATCDGGCFIPRKGSEFSLNLTDCVFSDTTAPRGGCFAIASTFTIPLIYISGCTFEQTRTSATGKTGGVFFVQNVPKEFTVRDTVFDRCQADNGAIMYRYSASGEEALSFTSFEMTNTVINQCTNQKSGGKVLAVVIAAGGTCEFNNNTLSNLAKDAFSISGWTTDQLELSGCRFDTLATTSFVLGLVSFSGTSLVLKNCQFSNVETNNAINKIDDTKSFTTVTLEECIVESVTRTSNSWIEITDGALSVKDCIFQDSVLSTFFQFGGTTMTIEGTEFREITTVPQLFTTTSQGTLDLTNVKVLGGSSLFGTLTCSSATIKQLTADKSTATGDWLVLQAGAFTLSNGCFQGGSGKYIKVESGVTLTFEPPMCFDKTQDESLTLPEGFEKTWTDDIFGCEDCGGITTTEEPLDSSDDLDPAGPSSEGKTDTDTTDQDGNQNKGHGLSAGETAAIVVVVLLVVAAAVVLTVIFLLRRKKKSNSDDDDAEVFDDDTSIATAESVELGGSSHIEEASRSNPIFSVAPEAEDFSSVFEETNSS